MEASRWRALNTLSHFFNFPQTLRTPPRPSSSWSEMNQIVSEAEGVINSISKLVLGNPDETAEDSKKVEDAIRGRVDNDHLRHIMKCPEDEKMSIQAFYNGTPLPTGLCLTANDWISFKKCCAGFIPKELGEGRTIEFQKRERKRQMDEMEKFLVQSSGGTGNQINEEHVFRLAREWLPTISDEYQVQDAVASGHFGDKSINEQVGMVKMLWYAGIYILMALGEIEDDEMNGWIIMPMALAQSLPNYRGLHQGAEKVE